MCLQASGIENELWGDLKARMQSWMSPIHLICSLLQHICWLRVCRKRPISIDIDNDRILRIDPTEEDSWLGPIIFSNILVPHKFMYEALARTSLNVHDLPKTLFIVSLIMPNPESPVSSEKRRVVDNKVNWAWHRICQGRWREGGVSDVLNVATLLHNQQIGAVERLDDQEDFHVIESTSFTWIFPKRSR
jgi:hypothetical protein